MKLTPPIAITLAVLSVIVLGVIVWRNTAGRYGPPPPIQSGAPSSTVQPAGAGTSTAPGGYLQPPSMGR